MIQPSRRRQPDVEPTALELHRRLIRQRRRTIRLTAGAAAACLVSLVGWLLELRITWHAAATLGAFAAGAASASYLAPMRRARAWALEWIAARAGLSYQAALELTESGVGDDRYGFAAAVRQRAAAQTLRLELPRPNAWWLPLFVAAVVLTLLPVTPRGVERALPTADVNTPSDAPTDARTPSPDAPPPPTPDPAPGDRVDAPDSGTPATLDGAPNGTQTEDTQASRPATDAEALQEFLQTLDEAGLPATPEATNPFRSVEPLDDQARGEPGGAPPEGATATGDPQPGQQPGQPTGQRESEQEGEGSGSAPQAAGESGENQSADAARAGGAAGEPGDQSEALGNEENAPDGTPAGNEQAGAEPQSTPEEGQGQGAPQSADGTVAPSEGQGGDTGARGVEQASASEGGADAGAGASLNPSDLPDTGLGLPQGNPELLPGQRSSGPSSLAGTVRLPGAAQEGELPEGPAASDFVRAEEEAIQEGRIPLEYQEIVRNYFR